MGLATTLSMNPRLVLFYMHILKIIRCVGAHRYNYYVREFDVLLPQGLA